MCKGLIWNQVGIDKVQRKGQFGVAAVRRRDVEDEVKQAVRGWIRSLIDHS